MSELLPSMIEVEYGDYYKKCVQGLSNNGFRRFHIDFGDGQLIPRVLQPWDKVKFIKQAVENCELVGHIMCGVGDHFGNVHQTAQECISNGFCKIYLHPRSFQDAAEFSGFCGHLFGKDPDLLGIVSEVNFDLHPTVVDFCNQFPISSVLQMGVPIGSGGQRFDPTCLDRLKSLKAKLTELKYCELDGGLTGEIVDSLDRGMVDGFAGWSFIADPLVEKVVENANRLAERL